MGVLLIHVSCFLDHNVTDATPFNAERLKLLLLDLELLHGDALFVYWGLICYLSLCVGCRAAIVVVMCLSIVVSCLLFFAVAVAELFEVAYVS